jgi:hypothetical protein
MNIIINTNKWTFIILKMHKYKCFRQSGHKFTTIKASVTCTL